MFCKEKYTYLENMGLARLVRFEKIQRGVETHWLSVKNKVRGASICKEGYVFRDMNNLSQLISWNNLHL